MPRQEAGSLDGKQTSSQIAVVSVKNTPKNLGDTERILRSVSATNVGNLVLSPYYIEGYGLVSSVWICELIVGDCRKNHVY